MLKNRQPRRAAALQRLGYSAREIEGIVAHIEKFDTIERTRRKAPDRPQWIET